MYKTNLECQKRVVFIFDINKSSFVQQVRLYG